LMMSVLVWGLNMVVVSRVERVAPRERRIHGKSPVSGACNKLLQNQLAQLLH
jgi:hypothetical protein